MRDRDIRNSMYTLLQATNAFDYLPFGGQSEAWAPGTTANRSANIDPFTVRDTRPWDRGGVDGVERDCRVKVTFTAADEDAQVRDEAVEALFNIACNALNEQALPAGVGGLTTMSPFTYFETARWLKPDHPFRQIEAIFVYRYLEPSSVSFDTTE